MLGRHLADGSIVRGDREIHQVTFLSRNLRRGCLRESRILRRNILRLNLEACGQILQVILFAKEALPGVRSLCHMVKNTVEVLIRNDGWLTIHCGRRDHPREHDRRQSFLTVCEAFWLGCGSEVGKRGLRDTEWRSIVLNHLLFQQNTFR